MNLKQTSTHSDFHISIRHLEHFHWMKISFLRSNLLPTMFLDLFGNRFDCTVLYCDVVDYVVFNSKPMNFLVASNILSCEKWSDYETIGHCNGFRSHSFELLPKSNYKQLMTHLNDLVAIILTGKQHFNFLFVSMSLFWLFFNFWGLITKWFDLQNVVSRFLLIICHVWVCFDSQTVQTGQTPNFKLQTVITSRSLWHCTQIACNDIFWLLFGKCVRFLNNQLNIITVF